MVGKLYTLIWPDGSLCLAPHLKAQPFPDEEIKTSTLLEPIVGWSDVVTALNDLALYARLGGQLPEVWELEILAGATELVPQGAVKGGLWRHPHFIACKKARFVRKIAP
ncbi:hypothetical protein DRO54_10525 [Candidatus Bathyarchaeota archaeon]|nr:MAG: hypothetical protein DRO54_10525 [Candidatus Bathyarchaeota archaeon]